MVIRFINQTDDYSWQDNLSNSRIDNIRNLKNLTTQKTPFVWNKIIQYQHKKQIDW